jgi:Ca2+-binding EF-hand superfamily protein
MKEEEVLVLLTRFDKSTAGYLNVLELLSFLDGITEKQNWKRAEQRLKRAWMKYELVGEDMHGLLSDADTNADGLLSPADLSRALCALKRYSKLQVRCFG